MTDAEKARELLKDCKNISFATQDMIGISCAIAAWKKEQVIENSRIWFESVLPEILLNHEPIGISDIFENFKKYIEGE